MFNWVRNCNCAEGVRNRAGVVGAEPWRGSGHPEALGCISITGAVVTDRRAGPALGSARGTRPCRCKRNEELALLRCASKHENRGA